MVNFCNWEESIFLFRTKVVFLLSLWRRSDVSLYLLYYVLLSLFYFQSLYFKLLSLLRLWRNNWVALKVTSPIVESIKFNIKYIIELYIVLWDLLRGKDGSTQVFFFFFFSRLCDAAWAYSSMYNRVCIFSLNQLKTKSFV